VRRGSRGSPAGCASRNRIAAPATRAVENPELSVTASDGRAPTGSKSAADRDRGRSCRHTSSARRTRRSGGTSRRCCATCRRRGCGIRRDGAVPERDHILRHRQARPVVTSGRVHRRGEDIPAGHQAGATGHADRPMHPALAVRRVAGEPTRGERVEARRTDLRVAVSPARLEAMAIGDQDHEFRLLPHAVSLDRWNNSTKGIARLLQSVYCMALSQPGSANALVSGPPAPIAPIAVPLRLNTLVGQLCSESEATWLVRMMNSVARSARRSSVPNGR